jgi:hypothetical protein
MLAFLLVLSMLTTDPIELVWDSFDRNQAGNLNFTDLMTELSDCQKE